MIEFTDDEKKLILEIFGNLQFKAGGSAALIKTESIIAKVKESR